MSRGALLRIPILRSFVPRVSIVSRPILPLTTRLASASSGSSLSPLSQRSWAPRIRLFKSSSSSLHSSSDSSSSHSTAGPGPDASLSQRLKHLIKSYGWYALGVYLILSALDFSVAFAAINILGAEQVSKVTYAIKDYFMTFINTTPPEPGTQGIGQSPPSGREGLYAVIVLAYTVHKTLFLPVRVGLTAAVTPRLVSWLTKRGWVGGAGAKRAAQEMRERVRIRRDRERD